MPRAFQLRGALYLYLKGFLLDLNVQLEIYSSQVQPRSNLTVSIRSNLSRGHLWMVIIVSLEAHQPSQALFLEALHLSQIPFLR